MTEKTVFVTNGTKFPLTDGWDGKKYDFKPGVAVEVPEVVARHVFGYKDTDKRSRVVRLGWVQFEKDVDKAVQRLAKFEITEARPAGVEVAAIDNSDMIYVENRGEDQVVGGWNGKTYSFLPGSIMFVPKEVARHILGWGVEDKRDAIDRLGWVRDSKEMKSALDRLSAFEFSEDAPHKAAKVA